MDFLMNFLNATPFGAYDKIIGLIGYILGSVNFYAFTILTYQMFGIGVSYSKYYYCFPTAKNDFLWSRNISWLFKLFMYITIASLIMIGQNYLYFIVGILFFIMAVNPSVNGGNIYFIPHIIGATSAITLGLFGLWICYDMWYMPVAALGLVSVILLSSKTNDYVNEHKIYFIEFFCILVLKFGMAIGNFLM